MSKAVTGPSGNIRYGAGNAQTSRSFGPSPKNVGYRSTVKTHAEAMKATKTKSNVPVFPRPASNIATFGNPK